MENRPAGVLATAIATWFGCGYFPVGPGTAGSLAALAIAIALHFWFGATAIHFLFLGLFLMLPGVWAADRFAHSIGKKDPGAVVVDEVVGQWITLAGAIHFNWKSWTLAFLLFRVFDIIKPPPVRQLEALNGGLGIVADDAMAGIYGALVLYWLGWCNFY